MSTAVHEVIGFRFPLSTEEVPRFAVDISQARAISPTLVKAGSGAARNMELPRVVPASRLEDRPAPATVMTGIAGLDALTGGLPRGGLTEICGAASSGRTSVVLALMAAMTSGSRWPMVPSTSLRAGFGRWQNQAVADGRLSIADWKTTQGNRGNPVYPELCALVDASDSFDPKSAEAAGVELRRLLWVRCSKMPSIVDGRWSMADQSRLRSDGRWFAQSTGAGKKNNRKSQMDALEQALKATDLLLQGGGFGLVVVDLGDVPSQTARRVPLTSWFRFRRAVENTRTVLVVVEPEPYAKTCASVVIRLSASGCRLSARLQGAGCRVQEEPAHGKILSGLEITAEVLRSSTQNKKPAHSAGARFSSRMEWAG